MRQRLKIGVGGPLPTDWSPRERTANVPYDRNSIKDREILNRPPTERHIRGIAPCPSQMHDSPIIEVA